MCCSMVVFSLGSGSGPADDHAVVSLHSDHIASLNQRSSRRGSSGGQSSSAINGSRVMKAMPDVPGWFEAYGRRPVRTP